MSLTSRTRGQPLLVLIALLGGWIGVRTALWQPPFAHAAAPSRRPSPPSNGSNSGEQVAEQLPPAPHLGTPPPAGLTRWSGPAAVSVAAARPLRLSAPVTGHRPMLLAALSHSPTTRESTASHEHPRQTPAAAPFQSFVRVADNHPGKRWSVDAWLLLRRDATDAVTSGRGTYGGSQAGATIRYRLASASGFRPAAYLRTSRALAGDRESELALGLAARPVPGIPVSAAAELRATNVGGHVRPRPAVYAVTELAPAHLPLGFTGEAYAEAGYVWGDFRTAFVDAQVRAEHTLAHLGSAEFRAGGGAWGGAQKGAARLDVGPSATVALPIGHAPARVSMDWRFRVAGDANPASGPALTVATGF